MVQTGDPTGTGKGGQSIWNRPFADEVRSTLKVRGGLFQAVGQSACRKQRQIDPLVVISFCS